MFTPIKEVKRMPEEIKKRIKAADDLFSTAVSRIRQTIEALFNWLIEKADIQKASKVRSTKGLIIHAFSRLAAVYITYNKIEQVIDFNCQIVFRKNADVLNVIVQSNSKIVLMHLSHRH